MDILFKDNLFCAVLYTDTNDLKLEYITSDMDLTNVPHIKDAEVLYHYVLDPNYLILINDTNRIKYYPVYYEHNNSYITVINNMISIKSQHSSRIKDYTLINIKLL